VELSGAARRRRPRDVRRVPRQGGSDAGGGDVGDGLPPGCVLAFSRHGHEVWFGCLPAVLAVASRRGLRPAGPAQRLARPWGLPDRLWIDFDDGASFACTAGTELGCAREEHLKSASAAWQPWPKERQPKWRGWRLTLAPERMRPTHRKE
jgi:hypothetical protein